MVTNEKYRIARRISQLTQLRGTMRTGTAVGIINEEIWGLRDRLQEIVDSERKEVDNGA